MDNDRSFSWMYELISLDVSASGRIEEWFTPPEKCLRTNGAQQVTLTWEAKVIVMLEATAVTVGATIDAQTSDCDEVASPYAATPTVGTRKLP